MLIFQTITPPVQLILMLSKFCKFQFCRLVVSYLSRISYLLGLVLYICT